MPWKNLKKKAQKRKEMRIWGLRDLDGLGVICQASVLRVGFGSAGITNCGPYDPIQAPEHGFGPPKASESENRCFQGLLARWVPRGFRNPIRNSDALCFINHACGKEKKD